VVKAQRGSGGNDTWCILESIRMQQWPKIPAKRAGMVSLGKVGFSDPTWWTGSDKVRNRTTAATFSRPPKRQPGHAPPPPRPFGRFGGHRCGRCRPPVARFIRPQSAGADNASKTSARMNAKNILPNSKYLVRIPRASSTDFRSNFSIATPRSVFPV